MSVKLERHEVEGGVYWQAEQLAIVATESGVRLSGYRGRLEREDIDAIHRALDQAAAEVHLLRREGSA